MRVLIALTYYRPHYSGLTIYAEREARALAQRGHQVTVLTSRFDPALPAVEVQDGVRIERLNVLLRISKGVIMPAIFWRAWKLIRQADVVHLHVPQLDAAPLAVLSRLLGKPVVLTYHCDLHLPSGPVHALANWVSNLANHVSARAANVIIHNTIDYAQHSPFLRHYLDKIQPLLPPVEVTPVGSEEIAAFCRKFDIQHGQRTIGMVSRLATEKGVEYLAEALPIVLSRFPEARVLFVGPYQGVLGEEAYARRLAPLIERLGHHWTFLGVLSPEELAAFYHTCEVTVLPSINSTESYGMVQVESMLCGTPVIATDMPGVRVPVQLSGAGLLVPPRDTLFLAKVLIAVLGNPEAFRGDPALVTAPSTPQALAEAYEKIFQRLTDKRDIDFSRLQPKKRKDVR